MKKLLVILLCLMPLSVCGQSGEYDHSVFDSVVVPLTEDSTQNFVFDLWFTDAPTDTSMNIKFDIYQVDERVFLSVVKITQDSLSYTIRPMVWIKPEPSPYDVNRDGAVTVIDLWTLMFYMFGGGQ